MDAVMATIDVSANSSAIRAEHLAWAEERLGPKPGKWDGYDAITDDDTRLDLWSKVGYINGLSAEAGRNVVAIGQTLLEMKEMLPHGQFMACVKAEFGWSPTWADDLMNVAKRFSNYHSSGNLPSSAKVLALLAKARADDATVQKAAEEGWTVAETKGRIASPRAPREPQPTEALALSIIRKGNLERLRQALSLADRASIVTADQVLAEQRLRQLPKGSVIHGADADFHRMKDGTWVRLPHEGMVDATAVEVEQPSEPQPQEQQTLIPEPQASPLREGVVLTRTEAAELLGINPGSFSTTVSRAKRTGQHAVIKGRRVEAVSRGMFRVI